MWDTDVWQNYIVSNIRMVKHVILIMLKLLIKYIIDKVNFYILTKQILQQDT